jgi:CheY-like chemotaxis protein
VPEKHEKSRAWQFPQSFGVVPAASFLLRQVRIVAHPRVLVADDDPELLAAVADALKRLGHDVVQVESGAGLVNRLANEGPFDLIVSDISMPWMDGLKALSSMRTAGVATPVIVMTALRDQQIPAQVQALGLNVVLLRKPFELDELEAAVATLVSPVRSAADRR